MMTKRTISLLMFFFFLLGNYFSTFNDTQYWYNIYKLASQSGVECSNSWSNINTKAYRRNANQLPKVSDKEKK